MKITRDNAMRLWFQGFGYADFAEDFDGGLMYRNAYGDEEYYIRQNGEKIYCGWNIHHILPVAHGGTNEVHNLICTNIITNDAAGDKITYWIDDNLYQVKKIPGTGKHEIVQLN